MISCISCKTSYKYLKRFECHKCKILHPCNKCGYEFKQKKNLNKHQKKYPNCEKVGYHRCVCCKSIIKCIKRHIHYSCISFQIQLNTLISQGVIAPVNMIPTEHGYLGSSPKRSLKLYNQYVLLDNEEPTIVVNEDVPMKMIRHNHKNQKLEGYFYIIQEREFIRLNEPTYKIGQTRQRLGKRMSQYPNNSDVKLAIEVKDCVKFEAIIQELFTKTFTHKKEYGKEYFMGDLENMKRLVMMECIK